MNEYVYSESKDIINIGYMLIPILERHRKNCMN